MYGALVSELISSSLRDSTAPVLIARADRLSVDGNAYRDPLPWNLRVTVPAFDMNPLYAYCATDAACYIEMMKRSRPGKPIRTLKPAELSAIHGGVSVALPNYEKDLASKEAAACNGTVTVADFDFN